MCLSIGLKAKKTEVIQMKEIKFTIHTLSNLLIGGNESGFIIGGIDQHTVRDHNGYPYIPGSSFKGVFRKIVRDDNHEDISKIFKDYKDELINKAKEASKNLDLKVEVLKFTKELEKGIESDSEYMFGSNGYNQSPQLLFSDIHLTKESIAAGNHFSIDAKNLVEEKDGELTAKPRTYKVARRGLTFTGTIRFRNFDKLDDKDKATVENYIKCQLDKVFDGGFYRLGNSKSRGYGHVEVKVIEIDGAKVGDS